MHKRCLAAGALLLFGMGCSVISDLAAPSFSAEGTFDGSWSARVGDPAQDMSCVVQLVFSQDLSASLPNNYRVDGTVKLNFTCTSVLEIYPDSALPSAVSIDVTGYMIPGGRILMWAVQQAENADIVFGLDAQGEDASGQGYMTGLTGDFTVSVSPDGGSEVVFSGSMEAVHLE